MKTLAPLSLASGRVIEDESGKVAPALDLGMLYRKHAETVARWAARLGGPLIDAEDVVQDVFLVAHRYRPRERDDALITTWLYRVTERVVKHRRRKDRLKRWLVGGRSDIPVDLSVSSPCPAEVLEGRRKRETVYRILDRLPAKQRTAFILFEIEGLPGEEIARLTGARVSTVWVWLSRARSAFFEQVRRLERDQEGGA